MLNYQRVVFLSVCELTHVNPRISGRFPRHFYRKSQASKTKPRHGLTSPEPGLDAVRSKESLKDGSTSNFGISMRFMEIYGDVWRFMEIYGDLCMEIWSSILGAAPSLTHHCLNPPHEKKTDELDPLLSCTPFAGPKMPRYKWPRLSPWSLDQSRKINHVLKTIGKHWQ